MPALPSEDTWQAPDRRLDRARRRLAEPADRRVAHALADLADERELPPDAAAGLARDEPTPGPPAGGPCRRGTARTGHRTRRGRTRRSRISTRREVDGLVEDEHDARAERGAGRARPLEGERHVEVVRPEKLPAAPPSRTACSAVRPGRRPRVSSSSRRVAPNVTSYVPGRATCPERQSSFVPDEPSVPISAKDGPERSTTSRTLTSVSTLLTTVGLPNRPTSTGNGGLFRGSPRFPSIDSKIAVSSPQM